MAAVRNPKRSLRHRYLTAVAQRVLAISWKDAEQFITSTCEEHSRTDPLPTEQTIGLAAQFAIETRNTQDSAARWCSILLLTHTRTSAPETVSRAVGELLEHETCKENLRAAGALLAGMNPLNI